MTDVIQFDGFGSQFEENGHSNGGKYWFASQLMEILGYDNYAAFMKAVNRAIGTCTTLEIDVMENFEQVRREVNGETVNDHKFSRFACYLIAMNGDTSKPQIAIAQAYFASMAQVIQQLITNSDNVHRVQIRDEISQREKTLGGVAKAAGVMAERYGLFHNAGYRGMYNMDYARLRDIKGVDRDRSLLDFMGKQELVANLFRITETEAKIRLERVRGQVQLENAAMAVGKTVRRAMIENSGTKPENLPIAEDIKTVRSSLKKAHREFGKIDKPKAKAAKKLTSGS